MMYNKRLVEPQSAVNENHQTDSLSDGFSTSFPALSAPPSSTPPPIQKDKENREYL